jgi:hypothetical protein
MSDQPISVFLSSVHIAQTLDAELDKVHPLNWGKLWANLGLLKCNYPWTKEQWDAMIEHLLYPNHRPWPIADRDPKTIPGYERALKTVDDIYQAI